MANEFKIKNGFFSEGNSNITGSLNVSAGITGSLLGTASFALAVAGGGGGAAFPFTGSAQITGSLGVTGSINDLFIGKGNGTNGASNVSIGLTTAFSSSLNAAAINNIAIGSGSMLNLNSGSNNIAIGQSTLRSNTSGSKNIAIGQNALCSHNTTFPGNIAIGYQTLQSGSIFQSIAIGYKAGSRLNGSQRNLLIGYKAGYGATGSLSSPSNNIAIGSLAGCNLGTKYAFLCNYISQEYGGYFRYYPTTTQTTYNTFIGYNSGRNTCAPTPINFPYFNQKTQYSKNNVAVGSNAFCSNTEGFRNTAIGNNSLRSNTTGFNNIAIGYSALNRNTTALSNTAIGYKALYSNTTGNLNTAIGRTALLANTTGANNIATGTYALQSNTTGGQNVAIGHQASFFNTTGCKNVAIGAQSLWRNGLSGICGGGVSGLTAVGYKALFNSNGGVRSTAIGFCAGAGIYACCNNVAIGYNSLCYNSGNNNTAVGTCTLTCACTYTSGNTAVGTCVLRLARGIFNVAIGTNVMRSSTTAGRNVAIGYASMCANTTGQCNVIIGAYSSQTNTTGEGNTVIGFKATSANVCNSTVLGRCATATANNQFVVGASAYNAGAVTTETVSSTKTWSVVINGVAQKILLA
jgi:hypothetical protein